MSKAEPELHGGNRLLQVAEGLQILAKHSEKFDLNAEHDIIYGGPTLDLDSMPDDEADNDDSDWPKGQALPPFTLDEVNRLMTLGWFVDREAETWAYFP